MTIALKEANETDYWLQLLKAGEYITQKYDDAYAYRRQPEARSKG